MSALRYGIFCREVKDYNYQNNPGTNIDEIFGHPFFACSTSHQSSANMQYSFCSLAYLDLAKMKIVTTWHKELSSQTSAACLREHPATATRDPETILKPVQDRVTSIATPATALH
jgi:hypothetical protein